MKAMEKEEMHVDLKIMHFAFSYMETSVDSTHTETAEME